MSEERKVLSRWSERKAAVRRGEAPPEPADEVQALDVEAAREHAALPEQAAPADTPAADDDLPALPSVDELNAESDYTAFLKEKVPEQLRRAALRKLWTSDPVLANLDGLNDYDEDYNVTTTVIGAVQSAWQAGRGYAEAVEEKIDKVEEALGTPADEQADSQPAEVPEENAHAELESPAPDAQALGNSDAAGDNSADASRQVAAVEAGKLPQTRE